MQTNKKYERIAKEMIIPFKRINDVSFFPSFNLENLFQTNTEMNR